jgi:hypothetical protein
LNRVDVGLDSSFDCAAADRVTHSLQSFAPFAEKLRVRQ